DHLGSQYVPAKRDYCFTLRTARDKAREYGVAGNALPVWVWIQLSQYRFGNSPAPTMAQVRCQAYVAAAYGAKGIMFWTLSPQHVGNGRNDFGYFDGVLDENGNATERYQPVGGVSVLVQ